MREVTCLNCGWVHMGVSEDEIKDQEEKPSKGCFRCGKAEFRLSKEGDCPRGATIQQVLYEG